ncbi:MAG: DUF4349 domain-containing protein [Candidatus Nanosalina sp.]
MNTDKVREFFDSDGSKALLGLIAVLAVGFFAQGFGGSNFLDLSKPQTQKMEALDRGMPAVAGGSGGAAESYQRSDYRAISSHISLEVKQVSSAMERIRGLTESYAGEVDYSSVQKDETDSGDINVRIPKNNYTSYISELEEIGKLESKSINTENLEDRYTELSLELENKRQELQQLEELMNSTDSVENLIKIQERMSELRSRIQYLDNRLSDMDQRIDYVRISINLHEPEPFASEFEIRDAFVDSYRALLSSIRMIIIGVGYLLPFAVLWLVFRKSRAYWRSRKE